MSVKNNNLDIYTSELDTYPRSTAQVGTVSVGNRNDQIIGTGTSFTELCPCQWIFIPGTSEVGQIRQIVSDTEMYLFNPLENAAAAEAYSSVPNTYDRLVSWAVTDGTPVVDGCTVPTGLGNTIDKTGGPAMTQLIDPIVFDTTGGGSIKVSYSR